MIEDQADGAGGGADVLEENRTDPERSHDPTSDGAPAMHRITDFFPPYLSHGGAGQYLWINGEGFTESSVGIMDGGALTTHFSGPERVIVLVPPAQLEEDGAASITVRTDDQVTDSAEIQVQ